MSFISSISGRACLSDWDRPLAVSDILNLLMDLKRALETAGRPLVLIVIVRKVVPVPASYLLSCLQSTLPAVLDGCQELVVVVEGNGSDRPPLRAAFLPKRPGSLTLLRTRAPTRIFDSLSAAFAHAQRSAPHDVLELQRHVLRQSFPPNGPWT